MVNMLLAKNALNVTTVPLNKPNFINALEKQRDDEMHAQWYRQDADSIISCI